MSATDPMFPTDTEHQPDAHIYHLTGCSKPLYAMIHAPAHEIGILCRNGPTVEELAAARRAWAEAIIKGSER